MTLGSLELALGLLTRLPLPGEHSERDFGASLSWFAGVGLFLALPLSALLVLGREQLTPVALAAVVVAVWTVSTGALHLDGLADSVDGWSASHADPRRGLEVMHDSRIGAHGAVALSLVLLLKFAALEQLLSRACSWQTTFVAVALSASAARGWVAFGLSRTVVASSSSMASTFASGSARRSGTVALVSLLLLAAIAASWLAEQRWRVLLHLGTTAGVVGAITLAARRRFGGVTGDVCGAMVETAEVTGLFIWGLRA